MSRIALALTTLLLLAPLAPMAGADSLAPAGELPGPRFRTGAAHDGEGTAYVIGGQTGSGYTFLTDVVAYDLATGTSATVAHLPSEMAGYNHAAWIDGAAYATGIGRIARFDPATNAVDVVASLGTIRGETVATDGVALYVFGGIHTSPSFAIHDDIVRFDPSTGVAEVVGHLPVAVYSAAATWTGSEFLIFGGVAQNAANTDVQRFDPATGVVTTTPSPIQMMDADAGWNGRAAYVFGGLGSPTIWRFDPATGAASAMPSGVGSTAAGISAVYDAATDSFRLFGGAVYNWGSIVTAAVVAYDPQDPPLPELARIEVTGPAQIVAGVPATYALAGFDAADAPFPLAVAEITIERTVAGPDVVSYEEDGIVGTLAIEVIPAAIANVDIDGLELVSAGRTHTWTLSASDAFGNAVPLPEPYVVATAPLADEAFLVCGGTDDITVCKSVVATRQLVVTLELDSGILANGAGRVVARYVEGDPVAGAAADVVATFDVAPVNVAQAGVTDEEGVFEFELGPLMALPLAREVRADVAIGVLHGSATA